MKASEIKRLIIKSLDVDETAVKFDADNLSYDFSGNFTGKVLDRIFHEDLKYERDLEFSRFLSIAFSRIALTGIAAILILLISIFIMEGSFSFNTLLGITDAQNEDIVFLLTGN